MQPRSRDDFETAVVCAFLLQLDAVVALFAKHYDEFNDTYGRQYGDANWYCTKHVGQHNMVLTCLPQIGKEDVARVVLRLQDNLRRINLAIVVGLCRGAPFSLPE